MNGHGPKDADLVFVGEAPGPDEDRIGRPFVGRAGKFMYKHMFLSSAVPAKEVRFENAVRCKPPPGKNPTVVEMRHCREYLWDALRRIKPKVVVALGNVPMYSLLCLDRPKITDDGLKKESGMSGITRWRGKEVWHHELNCWVVPTFHPSGLARSYPRYRHNLKLSVRDLELALQLVEQERPHFEKPKAHWIRSSVKALQVIRGVQKSDRYAVDVETSSLDWMSCRLLGIALSDRPDRGFYIDFTADGVETREVRDELDKLLSRTDRMKIMHNGAFDHKVLVAKNFAFYPKYEDTMIAAALVDENFYKGLKDLAWRYLFFGGYERKLDDYIRDNKVQSYEEIPSELVAPYAALDAAATHQLLTVLKPTMKNERVVKLYSKIAMPVRHVMTQAEIKGFPVDIGRAEKLHRKLGSVAETIEEWILDQHGDTVSNLNSPKDLQKLFFKKLGLKPLRETKTGYSTDAATLEALAKRPGGEIAKWILDRKYLLKQRDTFVKAVLQNSIDGRVHTSYNTTGTVTGRTSCTGMHNITRDRLIRSLYVASDGRSLIEADLKSAELRILAAYSGDEGLLAAFESGRDIHDETFRKMMEKADDYEPTLEERFDAKAINFGLIYGRGAASLAEQIGKSEDEAEELIEIYFEQFPGVRKFLEKNVARGYEHGYITSYFGRRRRLPELYTDNPADRSRAERQANNSLIQGTSADYCYVGLVRLFSLIETERIASDIVHTVHDCAIGDTDDDDLERGQEAFVKAFETPVNVIPIQMKIETDVMKRWGEHNESRIADIFKAVKELAA